MKRFLASISNQNWPKKKWETKIYSNHILVIDRKKNIKELPKTTWKLFNILILCFLICKMEIK